MTRRASRMLAALESGPKTRNQLYEHAGRFYLTNNAAAELRAAGHEVECSRDEDEYVYALRGLDERSVGAIPPVPLGGPLVETATLTEGDDGLRVTDSTRGLWNGTPPSSATEPLTDSTSPSVSAASAVGEDGQLALV